MTSKVEKAGTKAPFDESETTDPSSNKTLIHIRNQQRNGRKSLTTIQGLAPLNFDCKKLCKAFKKKFNCNGTVVEDEELGEIIQLQGDHRLRVAAFLEEEGVATKNQLRLHGA